MRLSRKILLLIVFLLCALAVNTMIGLRQLFRVGHELNSVASKDVVLSELITSIVQHQLERAVLLERAIRIAEELAFQDVSPARREHLLVNAKVTLDGFHHLAEMGALDIISGKKLIEATLSDPAFAHLHADLNRAQNLIMTIENSHIRYDQAVTSMMERIVADDYELSFEDIDLVQREERLLTKKLKELLELVQDFVHSSLERAKQEESRAVRLLWISFWVTLFLSLVVLTFIIRRIVHPLRELVDATHDVGEGNYEVKVREASRDEIGELSSAFNQMSEKIRKTTQDLAKINKDLETNLKVTTKQKHDLELMNKELDDLTHIISHDIRSPLTGVTGYSTILEQQYADGMDARGKRCITGIKQGAKRINDMITDLLELKRISRLDNPFEKTALSDVMESVLEKLEYKIQEHKVEITLPNPMPEIICDRIKIGIVFFNLINNAIKFSSKNPKEPPKVEVGYKELSAHHEFFVKDNGIGIDPGDYQKVFGIFKRLNTVGEYEGTGVGLSIVKDIVTAHDGDIWIASQLGQGAVFYFTVSKKLKTS